MSARKCWVVFIDDSSLIQPDRDFANKYNPLDREKNLLSVFFREKDANDYAKYITSYYPGREIYVFKQSHGFSAQTKPVEQKVWNPDGTYTPAIK